MKNKKRTAALIIAFATIIPTIFAPSLTMQHLLKFESKSSQQARTLHDAKELLALISSADELDHRIIEASTRVRTQLQRFARKLFQLQTQLSKDQVEEIALLRKLQLQYNEAYEALYEVSVYHRGTNIRRLSSASNSSSSNSSASLLSIPEEDE